MTHPAHPTNTQIIQLDDLSVAIIERIQQFQEWDRSDASDAATAAKEKKTHAGQALKDESTVKVGKQNAKVLHWSEYDNRSITSITIFGIVLSIPPSKSDHAIH